MPSNTGKFFDQVEVDYFRRILVKERRSAVKRYGCMFTCLKIRAVHIESAENMETDSFFLCLRNFVGRKWQPSATRMIQCHFNSSCGEHIWKRWMTEYVPVLTKRKKYNSEKLNLNLGDVVLVSWESSKEYMQPRTVSRFSRCKNQIW